MKDHSIILAGCGGMSRRWITYACARPNTRVAALVDINAENARKLASQFNLSCPVYADLGEALRKEKADLVMDCTVPQAHRAVVIAALAAGLDVFGEKPMALSRPEALEMLAAARNSGRMYAVMQNRRYAANIRALRKMIGAGVIGRVGFVCADFFMGVHFGGFREAMEHPLIVDMAIHTFDQARFILGDPVPVSAYCCEFNPPGSWYRGNAAAFCIFEFAGGTIFSYRGSWCSEGCKTPWEATWRVAGEKGTALWNGQNEIYAEVAKRSPEPKFSLDTERIDAVLDWNGKPGHDGCLDEMFAALDEGRQAETDCGNNFHSMNMVFGAVESARTGKKVTLA